MAEQMIDHPASADVGDTAPLLVVEDMDIHIRSRDGMRDLHIVDGVSFTLHRGQTLGIVGESGCGKSTTALALMRLLPRGGRISGGSIRFEDREMTTLDEEQLQDLRGARIAMIMQNPMMALDPLFTIGNQMGEGLRRHTDLRGAGLGARMLDLLRTVAIPSPDDRLKQYPHQMSGGMLQRIVGAMAMSCDPALLIADEPTTALDPTAQAQILDLLIDLRDRNRLALIVVTHDFGVTARMADHILVMYAGLAAEQGPARAIFDRPRHPYTSALMRSIPEEGAARPPGARLPTIPGSPPDVNARPAGCPFAPRCPLAIDKCVIEKPPAVAVGPDHSARCWRTDET